MPRSRAAPRPKPAPAARSAPAAAPRPAPQQHHASPPPPAHAAPAGHAPPPAMPQSSGGGGFLSGLMGSVAQGAALGTGSAIAHRAVDSFMGPRGSSEPAPAAVAAPAAPESYAAPMQAEGPCAQQAKAFAECMSRASGDMGACQFYFEAMQQCKMGQSFA